MTKIEEKLIKLGYKKRYDDIPNYKAPYEKVVAYDTYIYCELNEDNTIIDKFYADGSTWLWDKETMDELYFTFNKMKEEAEQLKEFFDEELKETWRRD